MRVQTKTSRAALLLLQCRPGALIVSDTPGCELQHGNDGFAKGKPLSSHSTFFCIAGLGLAVHAQCVAMLFCDFALCLVARACAKARFRRIPAYF